MRGFVGTQQACGVLPVFIGERLTKPRDMGVFEIGAIRERQFAWLAIEFLHSALREVFGQEVHMHEMHVAADPPARLVVTGQRAKPRWCTVATGHFLTFGAIATVQITRERVVAGPVIDGLGFLDVARPPRDGQLIAKPREPFQIRVRAAQRDRPNEGRTAFRWNPSQGRAVWRSRDEQDASDDWVTVSIGGAMSNGLAPPRSAQSWTSAAGPAAA